MEYTDMLILFMLVSTVIVILYKIYQHFKTPQANRFKAWYDNKEKYCDVVFINYDFKTGNEKKLTHITSKYKECNLEPTNRYYETKDISFFNYKYLSEISDVIILLKNGKYISLYELYRHNRGLYTHMRIKKEHNIIQMLEANVFKFIMFDQIKYKTSRKTKNQI